MKKTDFRHRTSPRSALASRRSALVGTPFLVVGVALAAANLRPAVTSVASVLGEIRVELGASVLWASLLTAVPACCFGIAAVAAPWLGRRLGMARAIGLSLAVLTIGLIVRIIDGPWVVLGGTVIACAGIAIGNVLIPVVVKESFPNSVGAVTGLYTAALAAGGGLGAAATPLLEPIVGGWRGAVGAWAALSLAALILWAGAARHRTDVPARTRTLQPRKSMFRSRLAWIVVGFFAMQASGAYILMGWLAEVFVTEGIERSDAGLMLAFVNLIAIPLSFAIPHLALNRRAQSGWIVAVTACSLVGVAGLAFSPSAAPWVWTVLLGIGMAILPLALGVITLRTKETAETATLSAMAQGVGYLIGATGPFLFGVLHSATDAWMLSFGLLTTVFVAQAVLGWFAGRPQYV